MHHREEMRQCPPVQRMEGGILWWKRGLANTFAGLLFFFFSFVALMPVFPFFPLTTFAPTSPCCPYTGWLHCMYMLYAGGQHVFECTYLCPVLFLYVLIVLS
jgi:hypothetical protein